MNLSLYNHRLRVCGVLLLWWAAARTKVLHQLQDKNLITSLDSDPLLNCFVIWDGAGPVGSDAAASVQPRSVSDTLCSRFEGFCNYLFERKNSHSIPKYFLQLRPLVSYQIIHGGTHPA